MVKKLKSILLDLNEWLSEFKSDALGPCQKGHVWSTLLLEGFTAPPVGRRCRAAGVMTLSSLLECAWE